MASDQARPSDEEILRFSQSIQDEALENVPLISQPLSLQSLKQQYEHNSPLFSIKIDHLGIEQKFHKTRGDGNCFYRAFAFGLFTTARNSENAKVVLLRSLKGSTELLDRGNISSVVYEDFLDVTCHVLCSAAPLLTTMNDPEQSNSIVVYLRFLTSAYLKSHRDQYQPYLEQGEILERWTERWVEAIGAEADNIQINALVNALSVGVDVVNLDGTQGETANVHQVRPDEGHVDHVVRVLYRPGHYDVLL